MMLGHKCMHLSLHTGSRQLTRHKKPTAYILPSRSNLFRLLFPTFPSFSMRSLSARDNGRFTTSGPKFPQSRLSLPLVKYPAHITKKSSTVDREIIIHVNAHSQIVLLADCNQSCWITRRRSTILWHHRIGL